MGDWIFVLVPVTAIVFTFIFLTRWIELRHAHKKRAHDAAHGGHFEKLEARIAARDRAIDELEQRIRVLERIVTDSGSKLSEEIDRLRA